MSLRNFFASRSDLLVQAVEKNDLVAVEKLMAKEIDYGFYTICQTERFKGISPEMAQLFLDKIDGPVYQRWTDSHHSASEAKNNVPFSLLYASLKSGRYDLVEKVLSRDVNFNRGEAKYHVASAIIAAETPAETKLRWLKKALSGGFDKIEKREELPLMAVKHNFAGALGLFAAIGFDLHRDNEALLAAAVTERHASLCRYLVVQHGADPEAVLRPARELGRREDEAFLREALKGYTAPVPAPAKDTALADEVVALRQMVRELTEKVESLQNPGSMLDKPGLKLPKS